MHRPGTTFFIAAIAACCCSLSPLLGQTRNSLTVTVTDPQGVAVSRAAVSVLARDNSAQLAATTNADGSYRFDAIAAGDYVVTAEARGFAAGTRTVHLDPGTAARVDIALAIAAVRTDVFVTADGTPQTIDEVSKDVSAVDAREIRDRDVFEVVDAISVLPGLRIEQEGGFGSFTAIRMRGLPDYDTAVLLDGLRLRDPTAPQGDAQSLVGNLFATDVDRIEVLGGAGSSLYGTNAVGGVVNIITDPGGGRNHGSILAEGGSLDTMRGRAQFAGAVLDDRVQYSAGVSMIDVLSGVGGDAPARTSTAQARLAWRATPNTQLFARFYAADSFSKQNSDPEANGASFIPSANDPDNTLASRFYSGAAGVNGHITENLGYSLTYEGVGVWRRYANGPAGTGFQPETNTTTVYRGLIDTANATVTYRLGHQLLDGGYEFEGETFDSLSIGTANVAQQSHTVFAQDQAHLFGDRLQLAASVRAQYFSLGALDLKPATLSPYAGQHFAAPPTAYTGDGSVAYFFRHTGTKIRGHAGRGYRAPSLYERFGTDYSSFGYSFYGDPRLRPERSISVDGGFDQSFVHDRARLSATYFYTRLQQVIIFDFSGAINPTVDPFGRFGGYRNTNGGLSRGVEVSAAIAPLRSLDLRAAYTYTNARERTPLVDNVLRTFLVPDNLFSLVATQRVGDRLTLTLTLIESSNYLAPLFDPVSFASRAHLFPGMKQAAVAANYRIPLSDTRAVRLFGRVSNLFDQTYYESGFRTAGITGIGGMQFEF